MKTVQIIAVASGWGARDKGCEDGPDALHAAGLAAHLQAQGLPAEWQTTLLPADGQERLAIVTEVCQRLANQTAAVFSSGGLPLVIGGDHSCAIGTWSGMCACLHGPLGLIWIDAHMDSHTPQTSPSGALHGMPLACLLGYGEPALTNLIVPGPKLLPQHVCLIGVRSFEIEEAALLERLGVRVFHMAEVHRRGMDVVFRDALEITQNGTVGFGISIDLDALDPREEPGVGSPAQDGVLGREFVHALRQVAGNPRLLALEIAEYNPHRDRNGSTARMALELAAAALTSDAETGKFASPE
jgi:arginase